MLYSTQKSWVQISSISDFFLVENREFDPQKIVFFASKSPGFESRHFQVFCSKPEGSKLKKYKICFFTSSSPGFESHQFPNFFLLNSKRREFDPSKSKTFFCSSTFHSVLINLNLTDYGSSEEEEEVEEVKPKVGRKKKNESDSGSDVSHTPFQSSLICKFSCFSVQSKRQ